MVSERERRANRRPHRHPRTALDVFRRRSSATPSSSKRIEQSPASRVARVRNDTIELEENGIDHGWNNNRIGQSWKPSPTADLVTPYRTSGVSASAAYDASSKSIG